MEKVSIANFRIPNNFVLLKPDPDYEFVEVPVNSGILDSSGEPVKFWIGKDPESDARHYGVTGTVIVTPDKLVFNKKQMKELRGQQENLDISQQVAMARLNENSMSLDVDMELECGDKVWFHYVAQINAVTENLLVDTIEEGMCFLVRYEDLYCYERNGQVELINGWVWIQRIEKEKDVHGIEIQYDKKNAFEKNRAIIVKAGKAVRDYLDGEPEDPISFHGGEEVAYHDKIGFEMEYSLHRKLTDKPTLSIRRRHIMAVI